MSNEIEVKSVRDFVEEFVKERDSRVVTTTEIFEGLKHALNAMHEVSKHVVIEGMDSYIKVDGSAYGSLLQSMAKLHDMMAAIGYIECPYKKMLEDSKNEQE